VSNLLKKEKGFTLIEIVLVLAIAGLILVIVFLAVSGAQKNRRDTQRKSDNARLLSQVEAYASNNNGTYPPAGNFPATYLPSNFNDPLSGGPYGGAGGPVVNVGGVAATIGGACAVPTSGTASVVTVVVNGRQVDTVMCLEQGYQDLKNY
jgi:prepilin-type N-terminal cleavage/methylation domain-containing protein